MGTYAKQYYTITGDPVISKNLFQFLVEDAEEHYVEEEEEGKYVFSMITKLDSSLEDECKMATKDGTVTVSCHTFCNDGTFGAWDSEYKNGEETSKDSNIVVTNTIRFETTEDVEQYNTDVLTAFLKRNYKDVRINLDDNEITFTTGEPFYPYELEVIQPPLLNFDFTCHWECETSCQFTDEGETGQGIFDASGKLEVI